jgi:hypothetical protein
MVFSGFTIVYGFFATVTDLNSDNDEVTGFVFIIGILSQSTILFTVAGIVIFVGIILFIIGIILIIVGSHENKNKKRD